MEKKKVTKMTNNVSHSDLLNTVSAQELGLSSDAQPARKEFATYVRTLLQNWRQGTVSCKGRSEVSFSNKKPWKQKGTGRARAGSPRSPLWRKGGVSHGPEPRTRTLQVNRKVKHFVLRDLVSQYANQGKVSALNWSLEQQTPKTSLAFNALKQAGLHKTTVNLFLPVEDTVTFASFANIPNVRILFFDQANAFDLAQGDHWVFLNKDFDHFKKMVSQWI